MFDWLIRDGLWYISVQWWCNMKGRTVGSFARRSAFVTSCGPLRSDVKRILLLACKITGALGQRIAFFVQWTIGVFTSIISGNSVNGCR
ncbi:hypothetical protein QUQ58_004756 [Escherichia coli]|nr:hypothetical protein [Escherichia coli]